MTLLVLGLVIFLGLHSIRIVSESARERAIARIGEGPWKGVYSALSAIGVVLIVWGFARARYDAPQLWTPPTWGRHITMLLMLIALICSRAFSSSGAISRSLSIIRCCGRCSCGAQATSSPTDRLRICCCSAPSSSGRPPISRRLTRAIGGMESSIPSRNSRTVGAIVVGLVVYALLIGGPAPLAVRRVAAGDVRRNPSETRGRGARSPKRNIEFAPRLGS